MKTIIFLYLSENCCISLSFWKLLDILYLSKNYYDLCIHLKIIIFLYVYLKTIKSLYLFKNCYDLCIYLKIIISLYLSENCFISVSIWKLLWSLYLSENYYISVSIWKLLYHCIYLNLLYVEKSPTPQQFLEHVSIQVLLRFSWLSMSTHGYHMNYQRH